MHLCRAVLPKTLPIDPVGLRTNACMLTKAVRLFVGLCTSSLCYESGVRFLKQNVSFRMRYLST
ncbi:hypothetical protein [Helicobacter pylori]|uniref:hypothetical protein n=1 Tax=Helicobacter pylori TaxID=210 RepID=UPI001E5D091C|nr:hypothetical protein [Helicobacter pylori]